MTENEVKNFDSNILCISHSDVEDVMTEQHRKKDKRAVVAEITI